MNTGKSKCIPLVGDPIPNEQRNQSQCPYPIQHSVISIAPPSYDSTINSKDVQGNGKNIKCTPRMWLIDGIYDFAQSIKYIRHFLQRCNKQNVS